MPNLVLGDGPLVGLLKACVPESLTHLKSDSVLWLLASHPETHGTLFTDIPLQYSLIPSWEVMWCSLTVPPLGAKQLPDDMLDMRFTDLVHKHWDVKPPLTLTVREILDGRTQHARNVYAAIGRPERLQPVLKALGPKDIVIDLNGILTPTIRFLPSGTLSDWVDAGSLALIVQKPRDSHLPYPFIPYGQWDDHALPDLLLSLDAYRRIILITNDGSYPQILVDPPTDLDIPSGCKVVHTKRQLLKALAI